MACSFCPSCSGDACPSNDVIWSDSHLCQRLTSPPRPPLTPSKVVEHLQASQSGQPSRYLSLFERSLRRPVRHFFWRKAHEPLAQRSVTSLIAFGSRLVAQEQVSTEFVPKDFGPRPDWRIAGAQPSKMPLAFWFRSFYI